MKHYPGLWDELLCLLPFEPDFFAGHNLPARFVGHPVLESGAGTGDAGRFRARHGLPPDVKILTVMPGSRQTEVSRLLPILEATIRRLREPVIPVVPLAGPVEAAVRAGTAGWPVPPILVADPADKYDAFAALGGRADEVRHVDAGVGAGEGSDVGDVSGQPVDALDRQADGEDQIRLDCEFTA